MYHIAFMCLLNVRSTTYLHTEHNFFWEKFCKNLKKKTKKTQLEEIYKIYDLFRLCVQEVKHKVNSLFYLYPHTIEGKHCTFVQREVSFGCTDKYGFPGMIVCWSWDMVRHHIRGFIVSCLIWVILSNNVLLCASGWNFMYGCVLRVSIMFND